MSTQKDCTRNFEWPSIELIYDTLKSFFDIIEKIWVSIVGFSNDDWQIFGY